MGLDARSGGVKWLGYEKRPQYNLEVKYLVQHETLAM